MTTPDRLHAVLAALCDVLTDHDDLVLASGISQAIDLHALAPLLPVNAHDVILAHGLHGLITYGNTTGPLTDADRALACRVAARLASTAALLLAVDPKRSRSTADALWSAAGRLSGLSRPAEVEASSDVVDRATEASGARRRMAMPLSTFRNLDRATEAAVHVAERRMTPTAKMTGGQQVRVGDAIGARDVSPRTLVECHNKDLVIRLPLGNGWTIDSTGGPEHRGWTWPSGMPDTVPVRIMATDIPADECWRVARMTPTEACEWLAQRVAAEPVTDATPVSALHNLDR